LLLLPLAALSFRRGWLLLLPLVLLPMVPGTVHATSWSDLWRNRNQQAAAALEQGDAKQAMQLASDPALHAAAAYRAGDYANAAQALQGVPGSDAAYNRGNALARSGKYEDAIHAYDEALKRDPGNADAKANRQAVEDWLCKQQKPPQDQQKNPSSQQQQKQDGASSPQGQGGSNGQGKDKDGQGKNGQDKNGQDKNDQGKDSQNQQGQGSQDKDGQGQSGRDKGNDHAGQSQQGGDSRQQGQRNSPNDAEQSAQNQSAQGNEKQSGQPSPGDSSAKQGDQPQPTPEQQAAQQAQAEQALKQQLDKQLGAPGQPAANQPPSHQLGAVGADDPQSKLPADVRQALQRVPDDPGALLRRKFQLEYQRRQGGAPDEDGP
jgi:Ca-activated chloride channel family protein